MPSRIDRRLCGSIPTVGSSRYSTLGLCSSATPMLTRLFMPPLNLSTRSFWRSTSVMSSSTSSTRVLSASPESPYMRPQKMRFSRALMSGYRAMS